MKRRRILAFLGIWALLLLGGAVLPLAGHTAGWRGPVTFTMLDDRSGEAAQRITLSPGPQPKIEPSLLKEVLEGDPNDQHRFIIELASQAQPGALVTGPTQLDRRRQVVAQLQATATKSQADLVSLLQARQDTGGVQEFHSFWVFNGLAVTADAETLLALAARPEVQIIRQDRWRRWLDPLSLPQGQFGSSGEDLTWNLSRVRADLAWNALGLDGSGVTVAIMDTGVDWQHPALQAQYRGYKPGGLTFHQGNWTCTTDEGYLYPVDGHGHGTHVAGLAVGGHDDAGQAIGMAPGARWIAAKMLDDTGYGYDSWIHAAFEWILAPAGDPALAPDVVNGSWGSTNAFDETFRADLQALRAAGIVAVFSAGNDGPAGSTLHSPGSYPEVITVGATDDVDQVTSFSSRGPSPWDEIKPEVVAPGAQIRSSFPGGTYGLYNGTSMATPHVTGVVALLLQADPALTADEIEEVLTTTALPLADHTPNNESGWGRIDAYAAAAVALDAGFVAGQVRRQPDLEPVSSAQIVAYDPDGAQQAYVQVDDNGHYELALPAGLYDLGVEAFGYKPRTLPDIQVQSALTTTVDLILVPKAAGVLWGQVIDAEAGGPVAAVLSVLDTPAQTNSDPGTGQYSLSLPAGTYTLQAIRNGYRRHTIPGVEIAAEQDTQLDLALTPAPTLLLLDSGRWYYGSQASYFEQALDDGDYVYDLWEIRDLTDDVPSLGDLGPYELTVWSAPLDAPGLIGAADVISNYLGIGGSLFLTGQDIGYWDGGLDAGYAEEYYWRLLHAQAVADNAGRDNIVGLPDDILNGVSLSINGPDSAGNQAYPDAIAVLDPRNAAAIGRYEEDGDAALRATGCQSYRAVYLAAGLEGLGDQASRAEVMDRALTWLDTPHPAVGVELYPPDQKQIWLASRAMTYTVELRNTGQAADRFALTLSPSAWAASVWDATFSHEITQTTALDACQTHTLGLQVTVPPDVLWNTTDVVTLTAYSLSDSAVSAQAEFRTKAPAPILLVDDHRWYDTLAYYQAALEANQLPYDVWTIAPSLRSEVASPSSQALQRYPVVIWFTAYDWYESLMPVDEERLAAYLDDGGRLLLSSQDYLSTNGLTEFAAGYLGVANFTRSLTTTQVVAAVDSPLDIGPNPLDLVYPFRNRSDTLRPIPAAQTAFWGQHGQPAALTLRQSPWRIAFFSFPLEAFSPQEMAEILGQTVDWLSPLGDSTFTVDRPVALQGEQVVYTLQINNSGPALLSGVTLSNTIPLSGTYVADSLKGPADYDAATGRISWQGSLAPGQTVTVGYQVQLEASLPDGAAVQNAAHLTDESGLAIERVAVSRLHTPDLSASAKAVSAQVARSAQAITYTLSLRNDGLRSAQAHLSDPIPLHTAYLADSAQASSGVLTPTTEALLWSGSISAGQAITITLPVVISPSATASYVLNRASLEDGWGDVRTLEAHTWVEARTYLPLVFKRP